MKQVKKQQSKIEKSIKKYLTEMQLEVEIGKFNTDDANLEDRFHDQLRKFVIAPFSERIHGYLLDLFSELNLEEFLLKELNAAKAQKKRSQK